MVLAAMAMAPPTEDACPTNTAAAAIHAGHIAASYARWQSFIALSVLLLTCPRSLRHACERPPVCKPIQRVLRLCALPAWRQSRDAGSGLTCRHLSRSSDIARWKPADRTQRGGRRIPAT